jgi:hypothetical protein
MNAEQETRKRMLQYNIMFNIVETVENTRAPSTAASCYTDTSFCTIPFPMELSLQLLINPKLF